MMPHEFLGLFGWVLVKTIPVKHPLSLASLHTTTAVWVDRDMR